MTIGKKKRATPFCLAKKKLPSPPSKRKRPPSKMAEVEEFEEVLVETGSFFPKVPALSSLPALTDRLFWLEVVVATVVFCAALIASVSCFRWISTAREMRRQKIS